MSSRAAAAAALAGVLALGPGCTSEHREADLERSRGFAIDAREVRGAAIALAQSLALAATALEGARRAGNEAAVEKAATQLKTGQLMLEWFEEAELTMLLARQWFAAHDSFEMPEAEQKRLDGYVEQMTGLVARRLERIEHKKPPFEGDITQEIERDRVALRAFRTALVLVTQPMGATTR